MLGGYSRCRLLDASDLLLGILDFEDQAVVALVAQLDCDRLVGIVDIPEHQLAVGVEPSR